MPGVERHFPAQIVAGARIGDFDDEQYVARPRMRRGVAMGPESEDCDVGLGLADVIEPQRVLAADIRRPSGKPAEVPGEEIHDRRIMTPSGEMSMISPSIRSTRSVVPRMPISPMR